jgi:hypothetical protein
VAAAAEFATTFIFPEYMSTPWVRAFNRSRVSGAIRLKEIIGEDSETTRRQSGDSAC